jgi:ABC-type transport system involved in cytochrome bd biosynthesis fused ATPase/permease subunit
MPAVRDLDLTIAPGELLAVRGPNGAGKSTLTQLVLRLLDPDAGSVTAGGVDLREAAPETWWSMVAWVPQRPTLLAASLADNVALARAGATRAEIRAALTRAGLADLLDDLPAGLETPVGDGGRSLSTGERRRVALARAFVRGAPLLVVDEPTAELDPEAAAAVDLALAEERGARTVLAVAHRPGIQRLADRVVTLEDGRLIAPASDPADVLAGAGT